MSDEQNWGFPKLKQITPTLVSTELIKVQPMDKPSGLVFYLDYKYKKGLHKNCAWCKRYYRYDLKRKIGTSKYCSPHCKSEARGFQQLTPKKKLCGKD